MRPSSALLALVAFVSTARVSTARAEEPGSADAAPVTSESEEYHTPLAGKPFKTEVFGYDVDLPLRDRGQTFAITIGSSFFEPPIGSQRFVPFAALYYNLLREERRLRITAAGLVNDLDYGETVAHGFEGALLFANDTLPFATTEIIDGIDIKQTSLFWGTVGGSFGPGWRLPVWPHEIDNELRVQVLADVGWLYTRRASDTPPRPLPPDTVVYGPHLRVRLDSLVRNLMELPHFGFAAGMDVSFSRRDHWVDQAVSGAAILARKDTRDYMKLSGYVVFATGVPFLSERHRFIFQLHGGTTPYGALDRFSAFRIGGGPPTTESADLARSPYPGAMFDQFATREYVLASFEYRLEIAFFLYLHLRATIAYDEVPRFTSFTPTTVSFQHTFGQAYSAAITSGFVWDSSIYVEYSYDVGATRAGGHGHALLVNWSKGF